MAITRQQIVKAIHEGTIAANKKYEEWSNGSWVTDAGVEGLMGACIAEAVNEWQEQHESLGMEVSFKDIKELSGAKPKRGPQFKAAAPANRADIVLFNRHVQPTCVIEVKRKWDVKSCFRDLKRIRDLIRTCALERGGSLRRGFLAVTVVKAETRTKSPEDRIKERVDEIACFLHTNFNTEDLNLRCSPGKSTPLERRFEKLYGNWRAASLCIEIYRRNRSDTHE